MAEYIYDPFGRRVAETVWLDGSTSVQRRYLYAGPRVLEVREVTAVDEPLVKRNIWSPEGIDTILRSDELATSGLRSGDLVSFYFTTDNMGSPSAALITSGVDGSGNIVTEVAERYLYGPDGQLFSVGESCRRADIDCDGMVGASDLVLVRNAYSATPPENAREDICGNGTLVPDNVIDDYDLACVRDELGKPALALYLDDEAVSDPLAADLPKPKMRLGLHGLPVDEATGLVFARARYYHPTLGRWLSRDPKGYVDGGNLYEAFGSNNARYADPMGTLLEEIVNYWVNDRFLTNEEIDLATTRGGVGLENQRSRLLRDAKDAVGALVDPQALLLAPRGFEEGYRQPAIQATANRFNSIIAAQVEAEADIESVSSQYSLVVYFAGDMTGVTQFLEGLFGVDLATNQMLGRGERIRRTVQGGSTVTTIALGPKALRNARARTVQIATRSRVMANIAESRAGRAASNFEGFAAREAARAGSNFGRSRLSSTVETLFEDALTIDAAEASGMMAAKSEKIWNPLTGPGPLGADVAKTFRSATYVERVLPEEAVLYRVYGGKAGRLSPYWTRTRPAGPLQAQMDSALLPEWGNAATNVAAIRVPAGTTIYEGAVAPQVGKFGTPSLLGGGNQVYIPRVDPSWFVSP